MNAKRSLEEAMRAIAAEATAAARAESAEELKSMRRKVSGLQQRVRELTQQRDAANARSAELRGYMRKYQQELAEVKRENRRPASVFGFEIPTL